jgi:Prolyl oligopeptidase family
MVDQIAVTRKLLERYSYLDSTRTAIWGWSYGGFATLMTLEQDVGPSPVFSCGISGILSILLNIKIIIFSKGISSIFFHLFLFTFYLV